LVSPLGVDTTSGLPPLAAKSAIQAAGQSAPLDGSARAAPVDKAQVNKAQVDKDFGAAKAARPEIPVKYLLCFESAGIRPTPEAQALIAKIVVDAGKPPAGGLSISRS
jgi:hypothetical protein